MNFTFPYQINIDEVDSKEYQTVITSLNLLKYVQKLHYATYYVLDYCKQEIPYLSDIHQTFVNQSEESIEYLNQRVITDKYNYERFCYFRLSALEELNRIGKQKGLDSCIYFSAKIKRNDQYFESTTMIVSTPLLYSKTGKICMTLQTIFLSFDPSKEFSGIYLTKDHILYRWYNNAWQPYPLSTIYAKDREIIEMQACGYTAKEVAQKVNLSVFTVRDRIKSLYQSYHIHNIKGLVSLLTLLHEL